jgi:hypothetical protein
MNTALRCTLAAMIATACLPVHASVCESGATQVQRDPAIAAWASGEDHGVQAGPLLGTVPSPALSVEAVLLRRQLAGCASDQFAGYVPKTEHDNTPWRFNADAGKKLSAAEFDAWMKSRGVRVAKGRSEPAAEALPAAAAAAAATATVSQ